ALFLVRSLVLPLIQFEAALNQNGISFLEILRNDFGLAIPCLNINKSDVLLGLATFAFPTPVDGYSKVGKGSPLRSITQFRVSGKIAGEDDFIKTGHNVPCG